MKTRSALYRIVQITDNTVFIEDLNGPMSVTNDAENVVQSVCRVYGNAVDIVYRDSMGVWDRLEQSQGIFTGFAPYHGKLPL